MKIKTLYYPGAGHDFDVIDHFHFNYGTNVFFYTDYHHDAADLSSIESNLQNWEIMDAQPQQPVNFGARSWRDFWHRNSKSHSFQNPNGALRFGHLLHLQHAPSHG